MSTYGADTVAARPCGRAAHPSGALSLPASGAAAAATATATTTTSSSSTSHHSTSWSYKYKSDQSQSRLQILIVFTTCHADGGEVVVRRPTSCRLWSMCAPTRTPYHVDAATNAPLPAGSVVQLERLVASQPRSLSLTNPHVGRSGQTTPPGQMAPPGKIAIRIPAHAALRERPQSPTPLATPRQGKPGYRLHNLCTARRPDGLCLPPGSARWSGRSQHTLHTRYNGLRQAI